jgi:hypothetical protein
MLTIANIFNLQIIKILKKIITTIKQLKILILI